VWSVGHLVQWMQQPSNFSLDYSSEIEDLLFANRTFRRITASLVQV